MSLGGPSIILLETMDLSARTGKYCIFGHLGLVFIWLCFVFCLLFHLFYVICAPVPADPDNSYMIIPGFTKDQVEAKIWERVQREVLVLATLKNAKFDDHNLIYIYIFYLQRFSIT